MDDKKFSDDSAQDWIKVIEASPSGARDLDIYPMLQTWIDEHRPHRVADIGCGQGICSAKIRYDQGTYVGVDPSPVLIERAKTLYPQTEFLLGNIYALPFQEHELDAIFSVAVWHLLEKTSNAAMEISRVLRPSGSFFLIMADPDAYEVWTDSYDIKKREGIRFEGSRRRDDGTMLTDVLYLREKSVIVHELARAGLIVSSVKVFRNQIAIQGQKKGA